MLESLAAWFGREGLGAAYNLPALVEEFLASLSGKLDFCREARNAQQLSHNLKNSSLWNRAQVVVPTIHQDLTTK